MTENLKNLIFFDFETSTSDVFYIVGFRENNSQYLKRVVLNSELKGVADAKKLLVQEPISFIIDLLNLALENNATLVAYSTAEKDMINQVLNSYNKERYLKLRYLNLRKAGKKWIKKYKKNEFEKLPLFRKKSWNSKSLQNSLASVMRLTDYTSPTDYQPGNTSQKFSHTAKFLQKKNQDYNQLTPRQKKKVTEVFKHNEFDVNALEVLFNTINDIDKTCLEKSITNLFD